jgi:hypothetical protein
MRARYIVLLVTLALAASATLLRTAPPAGATISGKIRYTGTPPKMKPIDMAKEPSCAAQHTATPVMTENVVTGPGNALRYVVVYVASGDQPGPPPAEAVRYDQKGCQYIPHVAVLNVNQPLDIYNGDQTSHNIHPLAKQNPEWNKSQPIGAPPIHTKFEKPEFIPVKCNIHPWMHGWFVVLTTSHHTVSGPDGEFSITGLAPGKYTVTAWHEQFLSLSEEVTVGANETKTVNFTFKATPY